MLQFIDLEKDTRFLKRYFENSPLEVCDNSIGVKFLWRNEFKIQYAIFNDTLILKESCTEYKDAFYFPFGEDIDGAFSQIEQYCIQKNIEIKFVWVDNRHAVEICNRFYKSTVTNDRAWSDYIYDAEAFKNFVGKKYSGQRNHINKFKKLYPNYTVKQIEKEDIPLLKELLKSYEETHEFTQKTAVVEDESLREFIDNMFLLEQVGLMIKVDDKCIAFSIGERVRDSLIVHVEKALTEYEGVYPFMANEFAKKYAVDGVKFINREEDCGDQGLRISKLQYHPIELREKNTVTAHTTFINIVEPIVIKTARLTINDIVETDKQDYFNLYTDDELNKLWGYDYREDLKDKPLTEDYFYEFQLQLKEKGEEYSLAVRRDGVMIGEVVMHGFDYHGGVEIGFRISRKYQGNGYALESVSGLIAYIYNVLKLPYIKGKCFLENERSFRLFKKLDFSMISQDDKYYHFIRKK